MPELPEVETSRRGIEPHLLNQTITGVLIRNPQLRWPIPDNLSNQLQGKNIQAINRRGKYILIKINEGSLILHLGMSGSLRISDPETTFKKHDHFVLTFNNNKQLRLHDPRRFGAVLWQTGDPLKHPLLAKLGPEPLGEEFNTGYLYKTCRNRKASIKQHIMNSHIVVGVGNIYASEALFLAGIHPKRAASRISNQRIEKLVVAIKQILNAAIKQGGTTLRDFVREDGQPGYFKQQLNVYGKIGEPCPECGNLIKQITQGQRSTYYCSHCQR